MKHEGKVLERVRTYASLSRWERAELGRDLRRLGWSYGELMEMIPVKKSTLATWCRDVELTEGQIDAIRARQAQEPDIPRDTNRKRRREVELIKVQARLEAKHLINDPLWVAGVSLYWGERFKTQNQLGVAMADHERAARAWWSTQLNLSISDFNKSFVKPAGTGHRRNHLEFGVCSPSANVQTPFMRPRRGSSSSKRPSVVNIAPGR